MNTISRQQKLINMLKKLHIAANPTRSQTAVNKLSLFL